MDIKKDISPEGEVSLEVTIPGEQVGQKFSEAIAKFAREVKLPGFRPGKVPLNHVRKMYGRELLAQEAEHLTRQYVEDIVKEENFQIAGRIELNVLEFGEGKDLKFKAAFPLKPEVVLTHYKGLNILINDADVTEKDVDEQLESTRRQHANLQSIDTPAPADAKLTLTVQEVDPTGVSLIGKHPETRSIELGTDELGVGTDEQLLGVKAGEKRTIVSYGKADPEQDGSEPHLIITPDQASGTLSANHNTHLSVTIESVEVAVLPEVDADFARQVNDKLESVEDLRKWVHGNMLAYVALGKQQALERKLVMKLVEDNPFPIAKSLIRTIVEEMADDYKLDNTIRSRFIEARLASTERDYRWVLLSRKVIETENILVSEEELELEIENIAKSSGDPIEKVRQTISENDGRDRLKERLLDRRVLQFLTDNAIIETRKLTLQEFFESIENMNSFAEA